MEQRSSYNTKQKNMILEYLEKNKDLHFTIEELTNNLKNNDMKIGKTTVYRFIEKLCEQGMVRKYFLKDENGACFQYVEEKTCNEHYHLKCIDCGLLLHLDCNFLDEISKHVAKDHNFEIDNTKTVLYGKCELCKEKS